MNIEPRIQKLTLEPGDILVCTTAEPLTAAQCNRLYDQIQRALEKTGAKAPCILCPMPVSFSKIDARGRASLRKALDAADDQAPSAHQRPSASIRG